MKIRKAGGQGFAKRGLDVQTVARLISRACRALFDVLPKKPVAVRYVALSGQYYRDILGRVFVLENIDSRIELFEVGTKNKFILAEYYHFEPSAALVQKIGEIAVGQDLRPVSKIEAEKQFFINQFNKGGE